jgi:hypothetical protein
MELAMKAKVVEDADVVTYVVVCDPGDEAVATLTEFARSERLEPRRSPPSAPSSTPGIALIDLDQSEA